ncbi:4'-phosphopantetheinyl transferase family protein [Inconstantimicrobium mannanitabidum]|uniref:4'-phosphopantetheinyl transferase n=1 Tax=Inconstantimicrobium mannanitabidum TaxID=1604901 RepID=A0ACB5R7M5_9CLOT|nr:4'-phosphopantetheinyl transferase superfamily protein [Clostridium sp. TW13]GKX65193.1 4'-phosphopantetheinyl transferase [Clostridium sp. TW13]
MEIYVLKISDIVEYKFNKLCSKIDKSKKLKIYKYINEKDRIRALIGEVLIRNIINKKLNLDNGCIEFEHNKYGKPHLKGHPYFNFNISHSEEYIVCAIDDKPIGIDIEAIKPVEYENIAKSFFSTSEYNYIHTAHGCIQLSRFYEVWTLKESYIKCCGEGLSIPLNSFCISIRENISVNSGNDRCIYTFRRFNIESGYKMAVCSLNEEITNDIIIIDQNRLINEYLSVM